MGTQDGLLIVRQGRTFLVEADDATIGTGGAEGTKDVDAAVGHKQDVRQEVQLPPCAQLQRTHCCDGGTRSGSLDRAEDCWGVADVEQCACIARDMVGGT